MSIVLPLRNGGPVIVDKDDLERLHGWGWHVMSAGYVGAMTSRAKGAPKRRMVLMHRMILGAPPDRFVDHINGNKLDNRKVNLRLATPTENMLNQHRLRSDNRSGILGVSQRSNGRWQAILKFNRHPIHLGMFATSEEAADARWAAEVRYFGALFPLSAAAKAARQR